MTTGEPAGFAWPEGRCAAALVTIDLDAESSMLHDDPSAAEHLDVLAHQAYGPRTGVGRLLALLERRGVRATFFVPGFTALRWPDVVRRIRDAGHEIGHHGFLHEGVHGVDPATEEGYLTRGLDALEEVAGVRPSGYRAPKFHVNVRSPGLLLKHGFTYDSSLQDSDLPYRLAAAPGADAESLIELPVQWALDDAAQYMYLPGLRPATTIATPTKALELWTLELDALATEGGCFNLTIHPFLSGRASRARVIEQLIEKMQDIDGLWIATGSEVAQHAATQPVEQIWHRPVGKDEM